MSTGFELGRGKPGAPIKRNRILIARTRNQANRWRKVLQSADRAAIHDNHFRRKQSSVSSSIAIKRKPWR